MKRFKYLTLAALVAFAACDEGEETPVAPPVTGSIAGVVTVEGVGQSGVTVTLSSGTTATTDGSGAYSFSGVNAGAYTVSISGFPGDATFSSTSKAATITTAGQAVQVNFDGAFVRTSAIIGSVSAGGAGLAGVNVSIGGGVSTQTDANGQYAFSGLRAGAYTVTISGFDASLYSFAATSQAVTLATGASEVVSFSGMLQATAVVQGSMFIDENVKNDAFDTTEEKLAVAGVTITLRGGEAGFTGVTTETDANGDYMFAELVPGEYQVEIDGADADIPGTVELGSLATKTVAVTVGSQLSANWPFDIVQQTVEVYAFYGLDEVNPGLAPVEGIDLDLYPTEADFTAKTNKLGSGTTDENGMVSFVFDRADDNGPQPGTLDRIVFVERLLPLPMNHVLSGETFFEFEYDATSLVDMAPDTFDVVSLATTVRLKGEDGLMNPLEDWTTRWWKNDTTGAAAAIGILDEDGFEERMFIGAAGKYLAGGVDTFYTRLSNVQAEANGHGFEQMAVAGAFGVAANSRILMTTFDGLSAPTVVRRLGTEVVTYTDMDIVVRVHREADDVMGYSAGDNFANVNSTQIDIYNIDEDGDTSIVSGPTWSPQLPAVGTGWATFGNVPVGSTFFIETTSNNAVIDVLDMADMDITPYLTGLTQVDTVKTLEGDEGISTFMIKHNNTWLRGAVLGLDGVTPADGLDVTIMPTADNIQSNLVDTTLTTGAAGVYKLEDLREGPYQIMVAGDDSWGFFEVLETTSTPVSSGSEDNDDETSGTRDNEGNNVVGVTNFMAERIDTEIHGVVINDRDMDFNTIDPNEALSGATMELYNDDDGDGAIDADDDLLLNSTNTAGDGSWSFTGLREGDYIVAGVSTATATVLRELASDGTVTDVVGVTTSAAMPEIGSVDTWADGNELPRWDYAAGVADTDTGSGGGANAGFPTTDPAAFTFLFSTGTITGVVTDGTDPVNGVTVTVTRCQTAAFAPSPPVAGACTLKHGTPSPWIVNVSTNATGTYSVSGLLEGVYQIDVAPATAGFTTIDVPVAGSYLATLVGDLDVETVADFEIS